MQTTVRKTFWSGLLSILLILPCAASAQASSITYQGQLEQSGEPFTGAANLQFRLFDQLSGGSQIGSQQTVENAPIADGLFQVELNYDPADLKGGDRYLEIRVNGTPLSPRQKVTATPYALIAATTVAGAVDASAVDPSEVQLRVDGTCPTGQSIRRINQNGGVVCETDDIGEPGWSLGGNSGTDPATDFIGTTDAASLEFRTANVRSLRIEPSAETFGGNPVTTNTIAGSAANQVLTDVRGATISGGGTPTGDSDPLLDGEGPNRVLDHYGTVGGGWNNQAGLDDGDLTIGIFSTVAGGESNEASAGLSTVSGGADNVASGDTSTVSGGAENEAIGTSSTVGGGFRNEASGLNSTVGGGNLNIAATEGSTVGGGLVNSATGDVSVVGGGVVNLASAESSTVGGGNSNTASGFSSTVGGGIGNFAMGDRSTVGGGAANTAGAARSTVGGGSFNDASGEDSFVGGGLGNAAIGTSSAVSGGVNNDANGTWSSISGGRLNCAGGFASWAGGNRAKVRPEMNATILAGSGCETVPDSGDVDGDQGTFIWADSQESDFVSTGPDQFLVRAQGGIGFGGVPGDYFEIKSPVEFVAGDGVPDDGAFRVRLDGATKFRVFANGGVGIGSSFSGPGVPQNGLSVLGNLQLGSFAPAGGDPLCRNGDNRIALCSSSGRYKDQIEPLELGLGTVLALAPVAYRWTTSNRRDVGFVAEDIAAIDERLITRNADGEIEGVRYGRLTAVLAHAVQEMHRREVALEARLAELESKQATELESLKAELAVLRELLVRTAPSLAATSHDPSNDPGEKP